MKVKLIVIVFLFLLCSCVCPPREKIVVYKHPEGYIQKWVYTEKSPGVWVERRDYSWD